MKFNIEIELDWIDEESTIDSAVQDGIISSVLRKIKTEEIETKIQSAIDGIIEKEIKEGLDKKVSKTYEDFISKEISITNSYGDIVKNCTIHELIKERFDNYLGEKVDDRGRSDSYNKNQSRINWMIENQIKKHSKDFTDETISTLEEKLKKYFSKELKERVGNVILENTGLKKLIADN